MSPMQTSLSRAFRFLGRRRRFLISVCPSFCSHDQHPGALEQLLLATNTWLLLDEFSRLVGVCNGREITQLEPGKWDSRSEYTDVVHSVAKATSGGPVRVYRVEGSGSRVEYFILGVDGGKGKLVGVKVLSVES